jgi:hypothetical protein
VFRLQTAQAIHNYSLLTMTAPTWKIAQLEREVATGKVTVVHYTVDLQDDTYSAGAYGSVGVDGEIAVPFKDLTEATCIQWVKDQLGEEKLQEIGAALQEQIENQRAPKVAAGLPW